MATDRYQLDAADLKALSIPASLHFMLGVELDLFACAVKAAGKPMKVFFPSLTVHYEKLLQQCATRLMLTVVPVEGDAEKRLEVSGVASLPLLRYVDYIPGKLHLDEIFTRFNVKPVEEPLPSTQQDAEFLCFDAHAIPYGKFTKPDETEIHSAVGHYYLIEMGIQLASHGHLVNFSLRQPVKDFDRAIRKFMGFSGWSKFDLRWEDEKNKMQGVLVFPHSVDAVELLDAYEDEDETNEETRLPFTLSPIGSTVTPPFVEDAQIRKTRVNHFKQAINFWETPGAASADRYTLLVSNFSERVSIKELLTLFDNEKVVDAALYSDESPHTRHRLFLRFEDLDAVNKALEMDAKHYHGAPLRVTVAPPYVNEKRRGAELATAKGKGKAPAPLVSSPGMKGMNVAAKEFIPRFLTPGASPAQPPAYDEAPKLPSYEESPSLPAYDEVVRAPPPYLPSPAMAGQTPPAYGTPGAEPPSYPEGQPPGYEESANNGSFAGSFGAPVPSGPPPLYLPPSGV